MNLVLVSGPDPGHALPALGLAGALRDRGHRVTVATGRDHRQACEDRDLTFLELPLLAPTPRDDDLGFRLWGKAADMAPPLAAKLRELHPIDVVVSDTLTRVGGFAAELLGVPWIELSPHQLMEPSAHLPPIGLGRHPDAPWWRRADDARIRRRQLGSIEEGLAEAAAARRRIGLPGEVQPPLGRLVATLPALEYDRPDWPEDAHVVGPLAADPPWPELSPPPGDGPLIVVTDTTATGVSTSIAEVALEALADLAVRVAITTGRDLTAPPGVVVGRGPHGPLLDRAAVAVGPGGHGFVTKALARGVPLVLLPLAGDQRETATRVGWAGVGRSLNPAWLRAPAAGVRLLRWTVLAVLRDERYGAAASRVAAEAADLGPDHAAALVEELVAAQVNGSGRSTATS